MIRTENLSMVFTTEDVQTRALNNVNLEIKQGEFVASWDHQDVENQRC